MKHIVIKEGRTFECYPSAELSGKMCGVNIFEVKRPSWRIFRTTYRDHYAFWVDDYESIQEGIESMVRHFLRKEQEEKARYEKWCALEKNGNAQKG